MARTHARDAPARSGTQRDLGARAGLSLSQRRLSANAVIDLMEYGETLTMSAHPKRHVRGGEGLRDEHRSEVWVLTGDDQGTRPPRARLSRW
ncbi:MULTISPECIES: hypothetical protein [Corallococcus]|uniref:hypothetical protein n=1 Tax=Corallococcus TaxID=83461 RepID=UPI00117EA745|nr:MULTISPECIES: hypothetical protein [Corallococcus]NBD13932.1 hypothetical protein [Corallococcus silvisoli]TSC25102.1 hypothetical protein FOF48_24510 [Corallococcus sp. Z5C101001]